MLAVQVWNYDSLNIREKFICFFFNKGYCDTDMSEHKGPLSANQGNF